MANYPGAIPSIPSDGSWTHDQVADEIEAIATELGVNPAGGAADVAARLAAAYGPLAADSAYLRNSGKMFRLPGLSWGAINQVPSDTACPCVFSFLSMEISVSYVGTSVQIAPATSFVVQYGFYRALTRELLGTVNMTIPTATGTVWAQPASPIVLPAEPIVTAMATIGTVSAGTGAMRRALVADNGGMLYERGNTWDPFDGSERTVGFSKADLATELPSTLPQLGSGAIYPWFFMIRTTP